MLMSLHKDTLQTETDETLHSSVSLFLICNNLKAWHFHAFYFLSNLFFLAYFLHINLHCILLSVTIHHQIKKGSLMKPTQFAFNNLDFLPEYVDLLHAFRNLGYTPAQAIADLCDNAQVAGSKNVWVYLNFEQSTNKSKVVNEIIIADQGKGFSYLTLQSALVPAKTAEIRSSDSLSQFGCGLITAGLSLGNKVEIFSRGSDGDVYSYIDWDEKLASGNPVNPLRACTDEEVRTRLAPYIKHSKSGSVIRISNIRFEASDYGQLRKKIYTKLSTSWFMFGDEFNAHLDGHKIRKWDLLEADNCLDLTEVLEYPVKLIENGKTVTEYVYMQMSTIKEHNDERSLNNYDPELSKSIKTLTEIGRSATYGGFEVCRRKRGVMEGSTLGLFKMTGTKHGFRARIWFSSPKLDDTYFRINVQKTNCQIVEPKLLTWVRTHSMKYCNDVSVPLYHKGKNEKKETLPITPPEVSLPEVDVTPSFASQLMTAKNALYNRVSLLNPDDFTGRQALDELAELKRIALS
jgi:hypothetical protein